MTKCAFECLLSYDANLLHIGANFDSATSHGSDFVLPDCYDRIAPYSGVSIGPFASRDYG